MAGFIPHLEGWILAGALAVSRGTLTGVGTTTYDERRWNGALAGLDLCFAHEDHDGALTLGRFGDWHA